MQFIKKVGNNFEFVSGLIYTVLWSNDTAVAQYESYTSKTFAERYIDVYVRFGYIGDATQGIYML